MPSRFSGSSAAQRSLPSGRIGASVQSVSPGPRQRSAAASLSWPSPMMSHSTCDQAADGAPGREAAAIDARASASSIASRGACAGLGAGAFGERRPSARRGGIAAP